MANYEAIEGVCLSQDCAVELLGIGQSTVSRIPRGQFPRIIEAEL